MQLIETLEPVDFKNYLKQFDNTICGRHPIAVFLNVYFDFSSNLTLNKCIIFYQFQLVKYLNGKTNYDLKFVRYSQSSKCKNRRDSSVSYASASCITKS